MKHYLKFVLMSAAITLQSICKGGVPLEWTRRPDSTTPANFTAHQGETLEFRCTFRGFGDLPFDESGANLYWQTNGMSEAWWSMPATVSSNTVSASWLPIHNPGAGRVIFFFGMQSNAFASAVVRFLPSPGFAPAVQPLPSVAFDAALMGTPTINGTNLVEYLSGIALEESDPTVPDWAKQPNPPAGTSGDGLTTNDVCNIVTNEVVKPYGGEWLATYVNPKFVTPLEDARGPTNQYGHLPSLSVGSVVLNSALDSHVEYIDPVTGKKTYQLSYRYTEGFSLTALWAIAAASPGAGYIEFLTREAEEIVLRLEKIPKTTRNALGLARLSDLKDVGISAENATDIAVSVSSPLSNKVDRLEGQVATIGAHLNTEDAKFIVTNYNSSTKIPAAHVQIRQKNSQTGEFEWLHIWNEMTRWNKFTGLYFDWDKWPGFYSWRTNIEGQISARAMKEYAFYDGVTGDVAPDGYFWIGQPKIAICAGASYQRYVNGRNAVWILESNGTIADINGTTNGYFRITDAEGKTHFEIVKGDKRTVYAKAHAMTSEIIMGVPHYFTTYAITNAVSAPIAHISVEGLKAGAFVPENDPNCAANIKWSSVSGGYTLEWWPKADYPSMFVYADYEIGGETYIRNTAPVAMQTIVIDGKKYKIGVSTVSGTKVLSLTEVE
ncbi:MAG: hypothetical protein E7046_06655 [Lentisphaerae bacterium]|nr:hypothetical protein [Lentisphaerota bacterium]